MRLDVRSKILLLLLANLAFLFRISGWIELILFAGLALILCAHGRLRTVTIYLLFFAFCWAWDAFLLPSLNWSALDFLTTVTTAGRFLLPSFMAASLLLSTSTAYELTHGLRKWHLPESLLLTMAVMLRFLPAIKADAAVIHRSLRLRGIFLRRRDILLRPLAYFEYLMIPLLMSLLRTVQELTMASLTKGLALGRGTTETFASPFRLVDWSVCVWMLGMLAWMISL